MQVQLSQLNTLVESLAARRQARANVRGSITGADADDIPDLEATAERLSDDIQDTNLAIEQIAVGSVDLEALDDVDTELDWRVELNQILTPYYRG